LSRQALGFSWCSSTSFSIHSDLGAIIAEQFLEVDLSAHLVGAEKGNNVRAISFDMHLLDSCKGRCYCVTGGVGEEGEEGGKLENLEMWLGVGPGLSRDANLAALGPKRELARFVLKTASVGVLEIRGESSYCVQ
jgi:hypothetical protein